MSEVASLNTTEQAIGSRPRCRITHGIEWHKLYSVFTSDVRRPSNVIVPVRAILIDCVVGRLAQVRVKQTREVHPHPTLIQIVLAVDFYKAAHSVYVAPFGGKG